MHLLVTDRLACPHCGPDFGLVLIADRIEGRRILDGFFGCANCRARYPVREGFADLRPRPGDPPDETSADAASRLHSDGDPDEAVTLAALLGLTGGSGFLLLNGRSATHASALSRMGDGFEVLAAAPGLEVLPESEGVSRLAVGDRLPFRSGSLGGVVLEGPDGAAHLSEASRVLAPGSRLVLLDPPAGTCEELESVGLRVVAEDETALVGALK